MKKYISLFPLILLFGCQKEPDITASDLARALDIVPITLKIPPQVAGERIFFHKETSDGRFDWFSAFTSPSSRGTVKLLWHNRTSQLTILIDDVELRGGSYTLSFKQEDGLRADVRTFYGKDIDLKDFLLVYCDSGYGYQIIRNNSRFTDERQNTKWVSYRLVAESELPENAPAYLFPQGINPRKNDDSSH